MALVDSGSTVSVVNPTVFERVTMGMDVVLDGQGSQVQLADGGLLDIMGRVHLELAVGRDDVPVEHEMLVAAVEAPAVVGTDFLRARGCILDMRENRLILGEHVQYGTLEENMPSVYRIKLSDTVEVPPQSEMLIPGSAVGKVHFTQGILESNGAELCEGNVAVARAVVNTAHDCLPVRVVNLSDKPQTLYKGMEVAKCEPVGYFPPSTPAMESASCEEEEMEDFIHGLLESDVQLMTDDEMRMAIKVINEFEDRFSKSKEDFSTTDLTLHSMNMRTPERVKLRARRLPLVKLKTLKQELQRLLDLDVIEPSSSSWASPIVLVTKKDGSVRLCVDYRLVNNLTLKDSYPLPRIDDSIDALSGSKWFSTLDLANGYWQVKMDPADIEKTAFTTPFGLYQFKVMPFGLANAPATFERLMERVLAGLHWEVCLIYIDDVIVFSKTFDEHVDRLRQVLTRLREANLKLATHKCKLFRKQVECLGHVVSAKGVETDPKKIEAISSWPVPKSVKEVRSFIGLCSYYRRFVQGFAKIARPLHKLTEKGADFLWTPECQEAFLSLREALGTPPILAFPSMDGAFILDTDASNEGIGSVLSQVQDGVERVIGYFSRALSPEERKYCVTRKELLAVLKSVENFHHYLYGRHFTIRTDHGSLRWLLNFKRAEGQMARWLQDLYTYDFEIQHRPGHQHSNADALSRRPCTDCRHCERQEAKEQMPDEGCPGHRIRAMTSSDMGTQEGAWVHEWTVNQISEWQDKDVILCKVKSWMSLGKKPPWKEIRSAGASIRIYWSSYERLELVDGVIYYNQPGCQKQKRLVAPGVIRDQIFKYLHCNRTAGHMGIKRTIASVRQRFWWPGLKKDVTRWCQHCDTCQRHNRRPGSGRADLRQDPVGSPMERIAFDILSFPEETGHGNKCVLVISDYFTKWCEAIPLPDHQAETVAHELVTRIFLQFGTPRIIHSDQAPEFMSDLMQELFRLLEITQTRTCPYRPQSDGLVERLNRTLIDMLSKFCGDNCDDWDEHLPYLMCAYRATVHESTKCTPNVLMLGREITLPVDLMFPNNISPAYHCHVEYVEYIRRTLEENFERARIHLRANAEGQKKYYDERAKDRDFTVGQQVLCFYKPNLRNKLNPPYIGPYTVLEKMGEVTYKIAPQKGKPVVVHVDHLKSYRAPQGIEWYPLEPPLDNDERASEEDATSVSGSLEEESAADNASSEMEEEGDAQIASAQDSQELGRGKRSRKTPRKFADFTLYWLWGGMLLEKHWLWHGNQYRYLGPVLMFILFSRWGVSASATFVELGSRARPDFIATVPRNMWSGVPRRNLGSICSGSMCVGSTHGFVLMPGPRTSSFAQRMSPSSGTWRAFSLRQPDTFPMRRRRWSVPWPNMSQRRRLCCRITPWMPQPQLWVGRASHRRVIGLTTARKSS